MASNTSPEASLKKKSFMCSTISLSYIKTKWIAGNNAWRKNVTKRRCEIAKISFPS